MRCYESLHNVGGFGLKFAGFSEPKDFGLGFRLVLHIVVKMSVDCFAGRLGLYFLCVAGLVFLKLCLAPLDVFCFCRDLRFGNCSYNPY